ncbi:hypothetical protein ACFQ1S_39195 [Kibdelosporangium lantanae]|uniref:Zinc-binding dehydrogenase n=1 Tax=Kibdelosporangium lantanae TaxID=1497396 RepID=A0ABW3MKL9_9PSEU
MDRSTNRTAGSTYEPGLVMSEGDEVVVHARFTGVAPTPVIVIQIFRLDHGRIAWCGAVGQYDSLDSPPPAPHNLFDVVGKSLRLEGFLVRNHLDARVDFERFLTPKIQSGQVVVDETVVAGFDNIVHAFIAMLRGENTGKMVVHNH